MGVVGALVEFRWCRKEGEEVEVGHCEPRWLGGVVLIVHDRMESWAESEVREGGRGNQGLSIWFLGKAEYQCGFVQYKWRTEGRRRAELRLNYGKSMRGGVNSTMEHAVASRHPRN